MTQRVVLRWTATVFALAALSLAAWYLATAPKTLRIAAGPQGSQQLRYLQSMARALSENREPFRLEITPAESSASAAAALDAGKVDLALLRSDDPTSVDGRSIVVLQKRHVFVVARQDRAISDWTDLRGKRIGLVRSEFDETGPLVERILNQYGVKLAEVTLQETPIQIAGAVLADGAMDALVFLGFPGQRVRRLVGEVTDWRKTPVTVLGVSAASALAFRYRDLEHTELPAGVFSGSPPQPPQAINTVAITHEIVASADMSESTATDLTRALRDSATRIRQLEDNAFNVEPPPVERPRRYAPHPGTAAYVNDQAMGFLETYSEYIWLTLFGLSIVGSSITGFLGWAGLREEHDSASFGAGMAQLLARLDAARSLNEVDRVEDDFDALLKALVRDYASGAPNRPAEDPAPLIALFSRLIDRRRAELSRARNTSTG